MPGRRNLKPEATRRRRRGHRAAAGLLPLGQVASEPEPGLEVTRPGPGSLSGWARAGRGGLDP